MLAWKILKKKILEPYQVVFFFETFISEEIEIKLLSYLYKQKKWSSLCTIEVFIKRAEYVHHNSLLVIKINKACCVYD